MCGRKKFPQIPKLHRGVWPSRPPPHVWMFENVRNLAVFKLTWSLSAQHYCVVLNVHCTQQVYWLNNEYTVYLRFKLRVLRLPPDHLDWFLIRPIHYSIINKIQYYHKATLIQCTLHKSQPVCKIFIDFLENGSLSYLYTQINR